MEVWLMVELVGRTGVQVERVESEVVLFCEANSEYAGFTAVLNQTVQGKR